MTVEGLLKEAEVNVQFGTRRVANADDREDIQALAREAILKAIRRDPGLAGKEIGFRVQTYKFCVLKAYREFLGRRGERIAKTIPWPVIENDDGSVTPLDLPDKPTDFEHVIWMEYCQRKLERKMAGLSKPRKDVFQARVDGLTYREIGEKMGISYQRAQQLAKEAEAHISKKSRRPF